MAKAPDFVAYLVEDRGEGVKANWREVAIAYTHRNDPGMDLLIPAGMSLSGRIVIMPRKEREDAERPATPPAQRPAGRSGPR